MWVVLQGWALVAGQPPVRCFFATCCSNGYPRATSDGARGAGARQVGPTAPSGSPKPSVSGTTLPAVSFGRDCCGSHRRLRLGPVPLPRQLQMFLDEVVWISLEGLGHQSNLDPLLNLLTLLRAECRRIADLSRRPAQVRVRQGRQIAPLCRNGLGIRLSRTPQCLCG